MPYLFAHHDILETLDVLRLHPTSPGEHAIALVVYALLMLGAASAARIGFPRCRTIMARGRHRTARRRPDVLGLAEQRP